PRAHAGTCCPSSAPSLPSKISPWRRPVGRRSNHLSRRGGPPSLEIPQDLLAPGLHAKPPVTFIENDGRKHFARPAGIVIDDDIVILIVTPELPQRHRKAAGDGLRVVETPAVEPPLEVLVAGRHDEDAVRLRMAGEHLLGPLDVDVQEDVDPLFETREHL